MVLVLTVVAIFSLINSIQCNTQDTIQAVIDELGNIEELVNGLGCDTATQNVIDELGIIKELVNELDCIPKTCKEVFDNGEDTNGVYAIKPDDGEAFQVSCDMASDGGGWTIFQQRVAGNVDFYRGWDDYVAGFGNQFTSDHWIGLEKIHRITAAFPSNTLRIDMFAVSGEGNYAKYSTFDVKGSDENYKLVVGGFSGGPDAGDSLFYHNNAPFSTYDRDNDELPLENCAVTYHGAWWYKGCHNSNLNGLYLNGHHTSFANGVNWYTWKGFYYSLHIVQMKVRHN